MSELRTDFKDEILQEGEEHRVYNIKRKGTDEVVESEVYLEKAYEPLQEGDEYGAKDINELNSIVNVLAQGNLLMNSDFRYGIINQRGQSRYTTEGVAIEPWNISARAMLSVNDGNVSFETTSSEGYMYQIIENCKCVGNTYTFAVKLRNQDVKTITITFEIGNEIGTVIGNDTVDIYITNYNSTNTLSVWIHAKTIGATYIEYMKVEPGSSYTGMPVWDESVELLKCKSLFQVMEYTGMNCFPEDPYLGQFMGMQFPVEMKRVPSLQVVGLWTMYAQPIDVSNFKDFELISKRGFYKLNFKTEASVDKRSLYGIIYANAINY